jgi:hypothetical protein
MKMWPYPVTIESRIDVLTSEIEILQARYNPTHSKVDVLYIADTISMLELRIKELEQCSIQSE